MTKYQIVISISKHESFNTDKTLIKIARVSRDESGAPVSKSFLNKAGEWFVKPEGLRLPDDCIFEIEI